MAEQRRKPGTPPKGGDRFTVRTPSDHYSVYDEAAAENGLALSDYVAVVLARVHGLSEPPWIDRERKRAQDRKRAQAAQLELPMGA
ncbi:MAG: hypothetical protein ACRDS9_17095 [Pseudonocardiaceae bacterium]